MPVGTPRVIPMIDSFMGRTRFIIIKAPPLPDLQYLKGKVGYIDQRWGNTNITYWCHLPYVSGIRDGIKLVRDEFSDVSNVVYYARLIIQFITFQIKLLWMWATHSRNNGQR
jgi:hypothetical protein